jgi:FkbM family methyltransferase
LGFNRYLRIFSGYKIKTLSRDKNEKDFFRFMDLLSGSKGVIIDVGANLGVMTVHLARRFPNSEIIAVEPVAVNAGVLQYNIQKYRLKNVTVERTALGNENGVIRMVMPVQGNVKQHGLCHVEEVNVLNSQHQIIQDEVTLQRLDDLEILRNKRIIGIKIDAENYEFQVLSGAREVLFRDKPLVYCELWMNQNRVHSFDFMKGLVYNVYCVANNQLMTCDSSIETTQNFIFVHPDNKPVDPLF